MSDVPRPETPQPPRITRILIPFDFGDPAARALAYARGLARTTGASIDLLHVVPDPRPALLPLGPGEGSVYLPPPGFLQEIVERGEAELDKVISSHDRETLRATRAVVLGDPRAQIVDHARREGADLIVMGTHGRKGLAHAMLGSVAEGVIRSAQCPVLVVR